MGERKRVLTGVVLLATFVGLLGWYFLASYIGHRQSLQIQEKMLTVHDDLLAIDGRHEGNKVAVGKFGIILLTKDGGTTGQRRPSGTTETLPAVSLPDHEHGSIAGTGAASRASLDACITRQTQTSG